MAQTSTINVPVQQSQIQNGASQQGQIQNALQLPENFAAQERQIQQLQAQFRHQIYSFQQGQNFQAHLQAQQQQRLNAQVPFTIQTSLTVGQQATPYISSALVNECIHKHETAENKVNDKLDALKKLIGEAADSQNDDLLRKVEKIREFLHGSIADIITSKAKS